MYRFDVLDREFPLTVPSLQKEHKMPFKSDKATLVCGKFVCKAQLTQVLTLPKMTTHLPGLKSLT